MPSVVRRWDVSFSVMVGDGDLSLLWGHGVLTRVDSSVGVEQPAIIIANNITPTSNSNRDWLTVTVNLLEFISCIKLQDGLFPGQPLSILKMPVTDALEEGAPIGQRRRARPAIISRHSGEI